MIKASIMCCGSLFKEMISRFSSEANSVINSPFISRSFVGSAVSKEVMYSDSIIFFVCDRESPKNTERIIVKKKNIETQITVDFFKLNINIE